jgi:flagellin
MSIGATSLYNAQSNVQSAYAKLASGKRINSAADNAAGLAIATSMTAQARGLEQGISNAGYGLSALDTANSGLQQINNNLLQMRDLAVQAGNSTLAPSDRQALQQQMDQLSQANSDIVSQTKFNGQSLLDGSFSGALQTGPNAGDTSQVSIGSASSSTLGVSSLDLSSAGGAGSALTAIDQAVSSVSQSQGNIGALQASIAGNIDAQSAAYENTMASVSRVQDTDYASTVSDARKANILQQVSIYAQQQQQASAKSSTLGLLANI